MGYFLSNVDNSAILDSVRDPKGKRRSNRSYAEGDDYEEMSPPLKHLDMYRPGKKGYDSIAIDSLRPIYSARDAYQSRNKKDEEMDRLFGMHWRN